MKIFRACICFLLVFCVFFTLFCGAGVIKEEILYQNTQSINYVLSLWHIDSFEGGVGSRKQFLLDTAGAFEKNNQGVLVMVTSMTKEGAESNFNNGIYPDMISFGTGLDFTGYTKLNVKNSFKGGNILDQSYAVPWCRGGYVFIGNSRFVEDIPDSIENLVVSCGEYTLPLLALKLEGVTATNITKKTPLNAYVDFINGKDKILLGTQRDIFRLNNRDISVKVKVLKNFNDLFQYISVTATEQNRRFYSENFIDFLISEKIQKKLYKIGMMSVFYQVDYDSEILNQMQGLKEFKTISAFSMGSFLKELQNTDYSKISQEELIKIKNILL